MIDVAGLNPTCRYSDRAEEYREYRPGYPKAAIEYLNNTIGLRGKTVADVGAGTGIFTRMLAENDCRVFAIEPNEAMHAVCCRQLTDLHNIEFISSPAERIALPAGSVDVVTVAQAFHWLDAHAAAGEFRRLLRDAGAIVLLWNELALGSDRRVDYERHLLRFSSEFSTIDNEIDEEGIRSCMWHAQVRKAVFPHSQSLSEGQLLGRMTSSSFCPPRQDPRYADFLDSASEFFDRYQKSGFIELEYETFVYVCVADDVEATGERGRV